MGRYATVVVDPPWATGGHFGWSGDNPRPAHPYQTTADVQQFPIPATLADNAWVFLWTTAGKVADAVECLKAWGLCYRFQMAWVKGGGPKPSKGPQYNAEYVIVGSKGKPHFLDTKAFKLANPWPRNPDKTSAKPEAFYELLRRVTAGPRLDIFNRRFIEGFDGWGDESPYG